MLTWDNGSIADCWSFLPSESSPFDCTAEFGGTLLRGFINFEGPRATISNQRVPQIRQLIARIPPHSLPSEVSPDVVLASFDPLAR